MGASDEYEYFQFYQNCGTLHCWINTIHHISLSCRLVYSSISNGLIMSFLKKHIFMTYF